MNEDSNNIRLKEDEHPALLLVSQLHKLLKKLIPSLLQRMLFL